MSIIPANFKPLRACSVYDLTKVKLPVYASFKHDGIRCEYIVSPRSGNPLAASRKILPIPNLHIRRTIQSSSLPLWLSGELIAGDSYASYHDTESAVMSREGEPKFVYWLFDYPGAGIDNTFEYRYNKMCQLSLPDWAMPVMHTRIDSTDKLLEFEENATALGFEGIVMRRPTGKYKYGRSTPTDGLCHRYVRLERVDCRVIGFKRLMSNDNPLTLDYLGYAKRSKAKANMKPLDLCGAVTVRTEHATKTLPSGVEFDLTISEHKMQYDVWHNQDKYLGKVAIAEFKSYGTKDKPRQPVFLDWRGDSEI